MFIEIGIVTALILIFGEILPKIYANRNAYNFSVRIAPFINILDKYILFWITGPMSYATVFLERRLGDKKNQFSVDQLSQALELTDNKETTSDEQRILEGIVNFGSTDTREVMCPGLIYLHFLTTYFKRNYTINFRKWIFGIPVYREKKDNIKGILYIKDLLPHLNKIEYHWQSLLKKPLYVPRIKN